MSCVNYSDSKRKKAEMRLIEFVNIFTKKTGSQRLLSWTLSLKKLLYFTNHDKSKLDVKLSSNASIAFFCPMLFSIQFACFLHYNFYCMCIGTTCFWLYSSVEFREKSIFCSNLQGIKFQFNLSQNLQAIRALHHQNRMWYFDRKYSVANVSKMKNFIFPVVIERAFSLDWRGRGVDTDKMNTKCFFHSNM